MAAPFDGRARDAGETSGPDDNPYGLNERQLKVVEGVLDHGEWVRAYREAGYKGKYAHQEACKLRNNPKVVAEVQRRREIQAPTIHVTPADILERLYAIVEADIAAALTVTKDGRIALKPPGEMSKTTRYAIKRVTFDEQGRLRSIEMEDKLRALTKLGERFGLWNPKRDISDGNLAREQFTFEERMKRIGEIIRRRLQVSPATRDTQ